MAQFNIISHCSKKKHIKSIAEKYKSYIFATEIKN